MHARITKSFSFDAAHWLPQVPENHKCRRLHGHTYRVILGLEGDLHPEMGWVEDYNVVAAAMHFDACLIKFYREMASKSTNPKVREIFENLLVMEQHEQIELSKVALDIKSL